MCGIIGFRTGTTPDDSFVKLRGQDYHNTLTKEDFTFHHYLLSITGAHTPQPYVKEGVVMLYNGEVYNHDFERSDGEVIIPLYKEHGITFPQLLDGEFAIALFDFNKRVVVFTTDPMGTKPLWINSLLEFGSYGSSVCDGRKVLPNTTEVYDLDTLELIKRSSVYDFDFDHQHKTTYDDWITAFRNAVRKRAVPNCFLGLSSGYDSGGIACELNKLGVKYSAYSIPVGENTGVMKAREELTKNFQYLPVNKQHHKNHLATNVERYVYNIKYDGILTGLTIHDDPASLGLSTICSEAKKHEQKVYLSGQGADEIMSDYSPWPTQSSLKGHYPLILTPWYNFHQGCQSSYLAKEEYVAGSHNIEARYPYLDKAVVQEFLWLTQELKNGLYKAPLATYLQAEGYPYSPGEKLGFST